MIVVSPRLDPNVAMDRKKLSSEPTHPYLAGVGGAAPGIPADELPTTKEAPPPRPAPAPLVPRIFGDYELLSEIARGGMGVVYRARQISLDRIVALKMILAGRLANLEEVERFRTEALAAAGLQHPNIVAVYEVGEQDAQHFFSMEYIEGESLSHRLSRAPLAPRDLARCMRALAQAVHYAHRQGVIHRDLKPSNILLDADGQPHITDFGLAKRLHDDNGQTRTGTILGTPSYMAPEQAEGRSDDIGPRSDVYSLGAVLYECLTRRPPFRNDNVYDTVRQVINDAPPRPRNLVADVDEDLELICMKCLEKDPTLRYGSADELAEDLRRYLDGEEISARSLNVIGRLTRMLDRSQADFAFAAWGKVLYVMAAVVGVEHVLVFFLMQIHAPAVAILAARSLQFIILVTLFLAHRGTQNLWPTTAAERELWSIWLGYIATYFLLIFVTRCIGHVCVVTAGPDTTPFLIELLPYPFLCLVAGLAFFVMGSNYWGKCYAFGIGFWALGAVLPFALPVAPLAFGLAWSFVLIRHAHHLQRLGHKAETERRSANLSPTQKLPPRPAEPWGSLR